MPVKQILQIGDSILREQSIKVEDIKNQEVQDVIQDLIDTHRKEQTVGLAAPQIGSNFRIFLTELPINPTRAQSESDSLRIYINPVITFSSSDKVEMYESCASVADGNFCLPVARSKEISIEAYDEKGGKFKISCNGYLARLILHEYDHLDGVLFIDKSNNNKEAVSLANYRILSKTRQDLTEARKITIKRLEYLS